MNKVKIKSYNEAKIEKYQLGWLSKLFPASGRTRSLLAGAGIAGTSKLKDIVKAGKNVHVRIDPSTGKKTPWKETAYEKGIKRSLAGTAESVLTRLFPSAKKQIKKIKKRYKFGE